MPFSRFPNCFVKVHFPLVCNQLRIPNFRMPNIPLFCIKYAQDSGNGVVHIFGFLHFSTFLKWKVPFHRWTFSPEFKKFDGTAFFRKIPLFSRWKSIKIGLTGIQKILGDYLATFSAKFPRNSLLIHRISQKNAKSRGSHAHELKMSTRAQLSQHFIESRNLSLLFLRTGF